MLPISTLVKYYPLVSEAITRLLPLIKGDKNKDDIENLEAALEKLELGMKETERWVMRREKEIVMLRWISLIAISAALINSIILAFFIAKSL